MQRDDAMQRDDQQNWHIVRKCDGKPSLLRQITLLSIRQKNRRKSATITITTLASTKKRLSYGIIAFFFTGVVNKQVIKIKGLKARHGKQFRHAEK